MTRWWIDSLIRGSLVHWFIDTLVDYSIRWFTDSLLRWRCFIDCLCLALSILLYAGNYEYYRTYSNSSVEYIQLGLSDLLLCPEQEWCQVSPHNMSATNYILPTIVYHLPGMCYQLYSKGVFTSVLSIYSGVPMYQSWYFGHARVNTRLPPAYIYPDTTRVSTRVPPEYIPGHPQSMYPGTPRLYTREPPEYMPGYP